MRDIIKKIIQKIRKRNLKKYGKNVYISKKCNFQGNIEIGDNVVIGSGAYFVSTIAKLKIYDNVVFAPNVTIYTGDHQIDILGKHIIEIKDKDKTSKNLDKDVIIESGCWIGTRVILLKGVRIGRGSVIGAGAIVTKDIPPYSIYTGIPNVKIIQRFNDIEIKTHEGLLIKRGKQVNSLWGEIQE